MFQDLPEDVDVMFRDVREAFASGTWLSGFGIPPGSDIAVALDTLKTVYDGGSSLKIGWDSILEPEEPKPSGDAGWGFALVLLGMIVSFFIGKRRGIDHEAN